MLEKQIRCSGNICFDTGPACIIVNSHLSVPIHPKPHQLATFIGLLISLHPI